MRIILTQRNYKNHAEKYSSIHQPNKSAMEKD